MKTLQDILDVTDPDLIGYCSRQAESGWPDDPVVQELLAAASRRKWPEDELRAIATFAAELEEGAPVSIPPLFAEAVLRACRGESQLLEGVPAAYAFTWSVALLVLLSEEEVRDV